MPHGEIVEDISGDCVGDYCTLREVLNHSGYRFNLDILSGGCMDKGGKCDLRDEVEKSELSDDVLMQFKLIEMFKLDESERAGEDVGWETAARLWSERYSFNFREVYSFGMSHDEVYRKVRDYVPAF